MLCAVSKVRLPLDRCGCGRGHWKTHYVKSRLYYQWSGWGQSRNSHTPRPVVLYGMVAFMWERERITDRDIKSCLVKFAERESNSLSPPKAPLTSPPPARTECADHAPNTPPESSPGVLTWLLGLDSGASRPERGHTPSLWSYFSWSRDANTATVSPAEGEALTETCVPAQEEAEHQRVRRREEEMRECLRLYRAHSEARLSELPLVGLPKTRSSSRHLTQALRLLEGMEERTRAALLRALGPHQEHVQRLESQFTDVVLEGDGASSHLSLLSDLACIGSSNLLGLEAGHAYHQTAPMHSVAWSKCYMQLELVGSEDEGEAACVPGSAGASLRSRDLAVQWSELLLTVQEQAEQLLRAGQHYLAGQFWLEEAVSGLDLTVGLERLEPLLEQLRLLGLLSCTHFPGQLLVEGLSDVEEVWSVRGGASGDGGSVAVHERVRSHPAGEAKGQGADEVPSNNESGAVWDWEFITQDHNYTAYRKHYKNTGLFQYKVIGHYDDITAKAFFEVQVDYECRKMWDEYAGEMVTVDTDQHSDCRLIHWVMNYPFPMTNREYLFVQKSWISDQEDTIVVMNRSALHPDYPDEGRFVRVTDYFSEMVIKSHSTVDQPGMDFELTYFDNPKTNLPSSCTNWVASSAMPDFMNKIHGAALKRHRNHQ